MQTAVMAEIAAGKALIDTAPTTQAGLDALERHLLSARYGSTARHIRRDVVYAGRRVTITGGDDGVE